MKHIIKKIAAVLLGGVLCLSLTACSSGSDKAYPVGLNGTEIMVGETTLSVLYDAGYTTEALNTQTRIGTIPIEPTDELEANSYYSSIKLLKDDVSVATITLVTDKEAVPASESVIGGIKIDSGLSQPLDTVTFDGVALTDLTIETFQEHVPGSKVNDDSTSTYHSGKNYSIDVNYENGAPVSLEVKHNYDVDYYS